MATADISAALSSIPEKKAALRQAFDTLTSFSSSLASFTLKWQDLEDHFASLQKTIDDRLRELESMSQSLHQRQPAPANSSTAIAVKAEPIADAPSVKVESDADVIAVASTLKPPRPELLSFCLKMDGLGFRSYIIANRSPAIRDEIGAAIRLAPDPARFVLGALNGFHPPKTDGDKDGNMQVLKRTCLNLLEHLSALSPDISPEVRGDAKKVALEWKGEIKEGGENSIEALYWLELLIAFRLVGEFKIEEVMDVFLLASRRKQAVEICKKLGFAEHMSDLIQKLSNKGRHLDAVKFVHELNLTKKYPVVPLLKTYLKDSKKAVQDVKKNGSNSAWPQNEPIVNELAALRAVIKTVEDYKLETEYPCENLKKRISQIEKEKAAKKRPASNASINFKTPVQQHQPNKRQRSLEVSTYAVASHHLPLPQSQSLSMTDRSRYMGLVGAYGHATSGSFHDVTKPSVSGSSLMLGRNPSPPRSYIYQESTAGSGLYDRPVTYGGYPTSGPSNPYASTFYR